MIVFHLTYSLGTILFCVLLSYVHMWEKEIIKKPLGFWLIFKKIELLLFCYFSVVICTVLFIWCFVLKSDDYRYQHWSTLIHTDRHPHILLTHPASSSNTYQRTHIHTRKTMTHEEGLEIQELLLAVYVCMSARWPDCIQLWPEHFLGFVSG